MLGDLLGAAKRAGWRACAEADARAKVGTPATQNAVLMYHSVGGREGNAGGRRLDEAAFRAQLAWLDTHYEFVDLPAALDAGSTPRVALTFDDGYRDFRSRALPILREFDAPATVFVIADRIGGRSDNGVPYLDAEDVAALAADDLVTVGNHTRTHPHLDRLDPDAVRAEVVDARAELEARVGRDVTRFCYPYGDCSPAVVDVVRESHDYATAGDGILAGPTDPHLIPRVDGSHPQAVVRWELTGAAERLRRAVRGEALSGQPET
ncbi:peptidoglycan/xylan/chitin deacetylase (PgdA/CDA1 family) [Halarchaeum rubridurum]|uniref:Peptidoglycan/xylan/chitin deacetylase (PgdA/CDA1 family) n=1 Tax=Halarchaeum rubridurum TaxID=489911 RepID=A0A830FVD7_9EURY|nr:polysaccharide deacetylase family protein [Halarchaeum rubridurum]MBP1953469.1 peptidoglycan/xylan/chitin deacetylase (PgdA/CDA1 family) [Halarchaeum rubridurum]GGM65043.1 polysaccharide deacetylase [Halarchaeum rubridurum]